MEQNAALKQLEKQDAIHKPKKSRSKKKPEPKTVVTIEPLEELEVTVKTYPTVISKKRTANTIQTRRKGLHWFTAVRGDTVRIPRTLVVESVTMDDGPDGMTLCITEYKDVEVSEEERAANRENIKRIATEVMIRMGIW